MNVNHLLWFDVKLEQGTTMMKATNLQHGLWFDVKLEQGTTMVPSGRKR